MAEERVSELFNEVSSLNPTGPANTRVSELFNEVAALNGTSGNTRVSQFFNEIAVIIPAGDPTYPGTPNLRVRHIAFGQNLPDQRFNVSLDDIDKAMNSSLGKVINSPTTALTITSYPEGGEGLRTAFLSITGTIAAQGSIFLPGYPKVYLVKNGTSVSIEFRTANDNGVIVASGKVQQLYFDGGRIVAITPAV
jgi:hypothetical protein